MGIHRERLSVTNLSSENNFADVSTECSSRHQGESGRSVKKYMAINSNVSHFFHFHSDDDWSIQSKRWQSYFPN